jgi:hypothetical protein
MLSLILAGLARPVLPGSVRTSATLPAELAPAARTSLTQLAGRLGGEIHARPDGSLTVAGVLPSALADWAGRHGLPPVSSETPPVLSPAEAVVAADAARPLLPDLQALPLGQSDAPSFIQLATGSAEPTICPPQPLTSRPLAPRAPPAA